LGQAGITNIETADQAAMALRPLAGDFSAIVFAIGIIGTGLLAIPILAGANAYAVSEVMGWKRSLNAKYKDAPRFYRVITISIIAGALLNFLPIKPFELLYNTAILNGVVAPPLMLIIMFISNNKKIMGKHTNSKFINIAGGMATLIMGVAGIALIALQFAK
jgi:Mn2+/Fe2+ NRAMP family transporter